MSGNSISTLLRRSLPAIAYSPIQAEVSAAPMSIHGAASFTNVHPSALLSRRGHPLRRRQVFQTSLFGCPRRPSAGPCGKCIPFGPSHSALFVSNPDEDKGSIILSRLRASEGRRNTVGISDDCSVCHFESRLPLSVGQLTPAFRPRQAISEKPPGPRSAGRKTTVPTVEEQATRENRI